ncbi:ATP-binding protein [Limnospira fusiformis]|uniref:ATP-binding protein n=1 Tax=Limnospira fusiformis TaxID=54297 RepID=UPI002AA15B08|nr:ATP-binding protein [Limnospira fusiformis LS22]
MSRKTYPIGTVISDSETPSFETVRIKLKAEKDVKPGTLVRMNVSREGERTILIGRIRSGYESNPNKSVASVTVGDNLGLPTPSMPEGHSTDIYRLVEADLIEEIIGKEIRSPQNLPNSGSEVFIADSSEVVRVLGLETDKKEGLHLGETVGGIKTDIVLKKSSIQRHFFIGGTTGSGKSYAMGVVAEELMKHDLPVIFLDTQDEYSEFVIKNDGKVVEPGKDFNIRISSLTESEFISILPKSMQDSSLQLDVATYIFRGLKNQILRGERQKFRIDDMLPQTEAASNLLATKSPETTSATVERKLETLRSNQIFGEGCGAADWRKFMYPCMAINCKNLMSRDLQIIATAVLRELQDLRLRNHIPPYVAVVDEAHLFVPQGEGSPCKQIIREGVRIGRHHGICMVLMTQSPVDIDKSVIRQCNTRLVFALEPDQLDAIKGVKADATDEMLRALPKMPQGTCLISGTYESLKHTIPVKIRQRTTPDSEGGKTPDIFQEMQDTWMAKITALKEENQ